MRCTIRLGLSGMCLYIYIYFYFSFDGTIMPSLRKVGKAIESGCGEGGRREGTLFAQEIIQ